MPNIVFAGNNERQYTITIPENNTYKYCVCTYGGLTDGAEVMLEVSAPGTGQTCGKYEYKNDDTVESGSGGT